MKFCIKHEDFDTDKKADEIIFDLTPNSNLIAFIEYIKKLPENKRYILQYNDAKDFTEEDEKEIEYFLNSFIKEYPTTAIMISQEPNFITLKTFLQKNKIPFIFKEPCYDIMEVVKAIEEGASELYIHGPLAFQLKSFDNLRASGIKIRVFVDAPVLSDVEYYLIAKYPEKTFWIRPEDIQIYNQCVDIFHIAYRASIKLDIYKNGNWEGRISDLFPSTKIDDVYCNTIPPTFANIRLNCGWKCGLGSCNLCESCMDFARELSRAGLKIEEK